MLTAASWDVAIWPHIPSRNVWTVNITTTSKSKINLKTYIASFKALKSLLFAPREPSCPFAFFFHTLIVCAASSWKSCNNSGYSLLWKTTGERKKEEKPRLCALTIKEALSSSWPYPMTSSPKSDKVEAYHLINECSVVQNRTHE